MANIIADVTITDNSAKVKRALEEAIQVGLEAIGLQAESNAKKEVTKVVYDTPESPNYVRTGNLRNRITHEVWENEDAVVVGIRLEYAPYVELGTSKMKPRPFLGPAVTEHANEYRDLMEKALKSGGR